MEEPTAVDTTPKLTIQENKKQARSRIEPATKQAQSRNLNTQPMRWKRQKLNKPSVQH